MKIVQHLNQKKQSSKTLLSEVVKYTSFSPVDFKNFIIEWNTKYQFDRWWRKKYNVAFGCEAHMNMSHIWMIIEYREEKFFEKLKNDVKSEFDDISTDNLVKSAGLIKIGNDRGENEISQTVSDKEFNDLDITQFNEIKNER
jgi:hypothetical protein